jgi:hypothetical protein
MAETEHVPDEQLAQLLQASRNYAFQQLAETGVFLPFGTQANPSGELEYVRVADEGIDASMEDFFNLLQLALTERAQQGEIAAAATVVNIMLEGTGVDAGPDFDRAIRVHVEAPGYSRAVIAPYRVVEAVEEGGEPSLVEGTMIAIQEPAVVFAG